MVSNPGKAINTWGLWPNRPLTLGFITLIQALCQQSFGLTLPQNCVSSGSQFLDHPEAKKTHVIFRLWTADRGGFFVQFRLFVRIETGKKVKGLAGPHCSEKSKGIPNYFPGSQAGSLGRI